MRAAMMRSMSFQRQHVSVTGLYGSGSCRFLAQFEGWDYDSVPPALWNDASARALIKERQGRVFRAFPKVSQCLTMDHVGPRC
ncbi:hypothetical protein DQ04_12231010 [Trypanosoma grayi]|uniref:hypothetical protein n=1 Tax=Trypanosoma grayi TaxID=71804 RepID=UPI0004F49661|nr:hypothetical protein DQ04_12231010 [Trypanosoma grayi]KEG06791.1 hypothetical protein DQ04_12231010 [Trypanosoma grayi]